MNIIIAGASRGVGLELVKSLRSEHKIYAIARDCSKLEPFDDENVAIISCDLLNYNKLESEILKILSNGRVDVLINCAATWTGGVNVKDMTVDFLKESIDLNFFTAFNPIKLLLENNSYSPDSLFHIINLGATASMRGGKSTFAFAMGKSSLRTLTQSISRELGPKGVHASHIIIDGLIKNDRTLRLNPELASDKYINMSSIIDSIKFLMNQTSDCLTNELDLRSCYEKF